MKKSIFKKSFTILTSFLLLGMITTTVASTFKGNSFLTAKAAQEEIIDKGGKVTWVDASVKLPYNYSSIIGFKLDVKLLTDRTDYVSGYGGVDEKVDSPTYNMKFPCYMLVVSKGASGTDVFNENTFGCDPSENYEHYLDEELAKKEITKLGVGEGYYVAGYLDNGTACKEGKDMVKGSEATLTYQGTTSLFDEGNPFLTFYGYTAEFEIKGIEWITGTPVIEDPGDWNIVKKKTIVDIPTVEKAEDQNGYNYVNIIEPEEGVGPFPTILWIHGGAWSTSSRTDIILNTTMEYFLSQGYAFVSAEYTLSDNNAALTSEEQQIVNNAKTQEEKETLEKFYKIKNPTQGRQMIYDLKLAVRFLRAHGAEYNLDTTFIGAMGESAGAHLSLLLATTNGSKDHEGLNGTKYGGYASYSSDVQAAAGYSSPTDLTMDSATFLQDYKSDYPIISSTGKDNMKLQSNMLALYVLGYDYVVKHTVSGTPVGADAVYDEEYTKAAKFMSPYWQVNADSSPMYLIHGEADGAVSITQSYAMELMAKQFMENEDVKTAYYPSAGHVEKKYFDVYSQFSSTYDFMSKERKEYLDKKANGDSGDNSSSTSNSEKEPTSQGGEVVDPKQNNNSTFLFISIGTVAVAGIIVASIFVIRRRKIK